MQSLNSAQTSKRSSRTINQPWTQVVLEGLRRLDENIAPGVAFPPDYVHEPDELDGKQVDRNAIRMLRSHFRRRFFLLGKTSEERKPLFIGAIVVAVLASVAVIGVPAGWYSTESAAHRQQCEPGAAPQRQTETPAQPQPQAQSRRRPLKILRRRQRNASVKKNARLAKRRIAENAAAATAAAPVEAVKPGAKRVVVTVTYDESGRVTQASGGDANALRIARQKRFPPGKAGSATVSIPIN